MLKDSQQRIQATDPRQSFIVQAPAGSGKTEILTQRYLRLLSTVQAPEQIVALTFTRKAASEMRERIVLALQKAAAKVTATTPHQHQTYHYAAEALAHSNAQGWKLLEQPSRLRIVTLDALCQKICQAIPLQEREIPFAQVTEKPQQHYQTAAQACLSYALETEALHQALKCLLIHLDNRQDILLNFFSNLLATRSQWLPLLYSARGQEKANYEAMIAFIEQHELARFQQAIPLLYQDELCSLARQIASFEGDLQSPRIALINWQQFDQIDRHIAAGLAALILTKDNQLRKSIDHHAGFKKETCGEKRYAELKAKSKELLLSLDALPDFCEALLRVKNLPNPVYDAEQWEVLQALFTLLPLLVGHLHLVFNEKNEVDFTAISQQALTALGDEEEPTDLALYLDNSIQHLLVDEFQDTSLQQFHLLTKLVHGWQPDDGRTLFVVGDPMQSIYRFRQAEVGLFLKAKQCGIGSIPLKSLELCCNFRSDATIVNWVNQQFQAIFPQHEDIESGAIPFSSSINVKEASETSFVKAWQFPNRQQEAQALIEKVHKELTQHPTEQIAILVRSRSQLTEIMSLLREHQIPFQGVDIELLANLPHLSDLWTLTEALLRPANRLAWLALLRSPLCGLTLNDLHKIANFAKKKSIYYALSQLGEIPHLTEEGRIRAQFFYQVMQNALATRHQQTLVDWLAQTLQAFQGDKILDQTQRDDLEQFWLLLDRFCESGQLADLPMIKKEFSTLYSQRANPARLHIMTIHKSKGLEFDCVMLPSLSTKSTKHEKPLLRWLKLPSKTANDLFLVSPIKPAYREDCLLYNYLAELDSEKENYELQRLFYVAATRAKKRLYLFDCKEKEIKGSFRSFLKNQEFLSQNEEDVGEKPGHLPSLSRLPIQFYQQPLTKINQSTTKPALGHTNDTPRRVGIVAHELLQWICDHHPESVDELPWPMVMNQLQNLGFDPLEQKQTVTLLQQHFTQLFNNPIGQWLCKAHNEECNEYEILFQEQGRIQTRIIDRTFVDQGYRWIIDFKTGSDDETAREKNREQVNEYAKLLSQNSLHPIRCGLYYLASSNWVEWVFD